MSQRPETSIGPPRKISMESFVASALDQCRHYSHQASAFLQSRRKNVLASY